MNKNPVSGAARNSKARTQEQFGKVTGSASQEAAGRARQAESRMQKACDDLKEALKNSRHR
ncbi:MAG: CsbD family protein [Ramlibacter sp.]